MLHSCQSWGLAKLGKTWYYLTFSQISSNLTLLNMNNHVLNLENSAGADGGRPSQVCPRHFRQFYEEMAVPKLVASKVEKNKEPQETLDKIWDVKEVREQHYDKAAKQWGMWTTSKTDKKTSKQQRDQRLLENQEELFTPELVVKPKGTDEGHQVRSSKETAGWGERAYKGHCTRT